MHIFDLPQEILHNIVMLTDNTTYKDLCLAHPYFNLLSDSEILNRKQLIMLYDPILIKKLMPYRNISIITCECYEGSANVILLTYFTNAGSRLTVYSPQDEFIIFPYYCDFKIKVDIVTELLMAMKENINMIIRRDKVIFMNEKYEISFNIQKFERI